MEKLVLLKLITHDEAIKQLLNQTPIYVEKPNVIEIWHVSYNELSKKHILKVQTNYEKPHHRVENIKNIFDLHAYDLYIHKKPRQVVEDVPQQTIEHEPEPEPYEEETQFQDNIRGKAFTPRGKHVNLVRRHIDKSRQAIVGDISKYIRYLQTEASWFKGIAYDRNGSQSPLFITQDNYVILPLTPFNGYFDIKSRTWSKYWKEDIVLFYGDNKSTKNSAYPYKTVTFTNAKGVREQISGLYLKESLLREIGQYDYLQDKMYAND